MLHVTSFSQRTQTVVVHSRCSSPCLACACACDWHKSSLCTCEVSTALCHARRNKTHLLVLARKLLDLVLALGGLYRLGDAADLAWERLDSDEDLCKDGEWLPPAEVGYMPALLDAITSILAVDGLSPEQYTAVSTMLSTLLRQAFVTYLPKMQCKQERTMKL